MARRYTRSALYEDLKSINENFAGTGYYLAAQSRNGYVGLDEYRDDPSKGTAGRCIRNIACGTPRECLEAAQVYEPTITEV